MSTVTFNTMQLNYVQHLLAQRVFAESTANPSTSGHLSSNPNFRAADLAVAQGILKLHQTSAAGGNATLVLTAAQAAYLRAVIVQEVADEAKTAPANSGNMSNNPTFQSAELSAAKQVLALLQAAG
jgi:hypothetical protein